MIIERAEANAEVVPARRTIVTALPLKRGARERLAQLLGARVFDVRDPVEHVDLVLTPACSPQLINALAIKYGGAQVVVVELDDWEFGIEVSGPVKRILRSGASAYVLADSIDELARKISAPSASSSSAGAPATAETPGELPTSTATVDDLIAAFLRESVAYSARHHQGAPPRTASD